MFVNLTLQLLWISYAPIITPAAKFYGVTDTQIAALAVTSWLIAYLVLSIPASWAIDTYGIYITVGLGAILMAVFGVLRGFAVNYTQVFWMTAGIAIAQPFLLNSWTKFAAHWFGVGRPRHHCWSSHTFQPRLASPLAKPCLHFFYRAACPFRSSN